MVLRRDDWLDLARKVDWTPRYVEERELFPEEISGRPWLTHDAWRDWNEVYRTTYREYVANQREKDAAVLAYVQALRSYWTSYYHLRRVTLYDFAAEQEMAGVPER